MQTQLRRIVVLALVLSGTALLKAQQSKAPTLIKPLDPQAMTNVLKLPAGHTVSSAPNKGETYHMLDAAAVRVTTVFDTLTTISERDVQGTMTTRYIDTVGNDLGTRHRPPTTEHIQEVRTEWPDDLIAHSKTLKNASAGSFATNFTQHGVRIGWVSWHAKPRVMVWSFPGVTEGLLDDARLADIGGWPFIPDQTWINVQAYAYYFYYKLPKDKGIAEVRPAPPSLAATLLQYLLPTLHANEPGCDAGLHWLDVSVFRPCCDRHDRCYGKDGCTARSWRHPFETGWQCLKCNIVVTLCFFGGGMGGDPDDPYRQSPPFP